MKTVLLVIAILVGTVNLDAQVNRDKMEPFIGIWGRDPAQDRGNCAGRRGDAGELLENCSLPADQLPLNSRGKAWLEFTD